MTDDREFVERFQAAAAAHGRPFRSPFGMIEAWEALVDSVEDGYQFTIYEYVDELDVRGFVERLLQDESLSDVDQMGWVREPRRDDRCPVGPELVADIRERYGATIEERQPSAVRSSAPVPTVASLRR